MSCPRITRMTANGKQPAICTAANGGLRFSLSLHRMRGEGWGEGSCASAQAAPPLIRPTATFSPPPRKGEGARGSLWISVRTHVSSLSQRERAGVREKACEVSVDSCAQRLPCLSPSPYPSPAGRGDDAGHVGVRCRPSPVGRVSPWTDVRAYVFSLAQRERAGVRENGCEVSVDTCAQRLHCLSPSPYHSPAGRGVDTVTGGISPDYPVQARALHAKDAKDAKEAGSCHPEHKSGNLAHNSEVSFEEIKVANWSSLCALCVLCVRNSLHGLGLHRE